MAIANSHVVSRGFSTALPEVETHGLRVQNLVEVPMVAVLRLRGRLERRRYEGFRVFQSAAAGDVL